MILSSTTKKYCHHAIFNSKKENEMEFAGIFRKLLSCTMLMILLYPVHTVAQSRSEIIADELYETYAYSKAAEVYEKLYEASPQNSKYIQRLAYCYDKMLSYDKATLYYSNLVKLDICTVEDIYEYAQLLKIGGKIEESQVWLQKYISRAPDDRRAQLQLENINQLLKLKSDIKDISVKNMEGNTRFIDMCAAFYKDRIVFSSARDSFSMVKNNYEWNNQPFLDLYVSMPEPVSSIQNATPFSTKLNSRFHEGPVCFTSDYNTIYFTRNSYLKGKVSRTPNGVNNLRIFIADFDGKEWKNIRDFAFNSDKYSVGHPALSPDNKTLYFVSDMPGGYGETDIYKSEWVDGNWGKPVNLGESINTKGKEMFPFIDREGILYFSSDGHPGIGGLDNFAARQEEKNTFIVVNLGAPINSGHDDFGYIINKESLSGYFSSNRPGGKGDDDIYSFSVSKVSLKVICYKEGSHTIMPGTKVTLMGADSSMLSSLIADQNGAVEFSVDPGAHYQIIGENQEFHSEVKTINMLKNSFNFQQTEEIYLKRKFALLTIKVIDKESKSPITNAIVDIPQGDYDNSALGVENGVVSMKINKSTNYTFEANAEGYFSNTANFSSADKVPGEYSLTIELEKLSVGKQFVLEDLYYDLNKYNIRPDAALVLDKLVKILVTNPQVRIEIGSHTDCRASNNYNFRLSQNRSEAVLAYLVSKGINARRLVAKGYGESQLVNKCSDGVECTEEEHQANRRTVIKILNKEIQMVNRGGKDVYIF
jgi:outer membrane protein OmpA-like peptidoglycan-associated protein/tetratricopeptide (TPR) repeat protein